MSVIHQAGSLALPRRSTQRVKPNCTHTDLDRLYGPFACDICQRPSPLGWLYKCNQNNRARQQLEHQSTPVDSFMDEDASTTHRSLNDELQTLGFSASVISQANAGLYTAFQIQKLKDQKQHLLGIMAALTPPPPFADEYEPIGNSTSHQPRSLEQPFGETAAATNDRDSAQSHKACTTSAHVSQIARSKLATSAPCSFKCCHHCRPYLIERVWGSFDAVFADEVRPLSVADTRILPIKSPLIARDLGKSTDRSTTSPSSSKSQISPSDTCRFLDLTDTTPTTATSEDFPYSDYSYSSSENNCEGGHWSKPDDGTYQNTDLGFDVACTNPRHPISTPDHTMHRTIRRVSGSIGDASPSCSISSSSSISLPTLSTARTSPMRSFADHELCDTGMTHCFGRRFDRSDSFSDLPDLIQVGTTIIIPGGNIITGLQSVAATSIDRSSSTDSLGYLGNEMEVDGGIALTEEAVRTHTPDLITDDTLS